MENIEFYAYPARNDQGLELTIETDHHQPFLVSPSDKAQLDLDWIERGYTRSSPIGTLFDTSFNDRTGKTQLVYRVTEYKIYLGIAFPALPDTEEKISSQLKDAMRISAIGCAIETADEKIIIQRRKEGLSSGGMLDSGASGAMVYDTSAAKLDWQQQAEEKLSRELHIIDSQIHSLLPTAVFSSRGPAHIPAPKGYFTGCYSGMVSSLAKVSLSYDALKEIFDKKRSG